MVSWEWGLLSCKPSYSYRKWQLLHVFLLQAYKYIIPTGLSSVVWCSVLGLCVQTKKAERKIKAEFGVPFSIVYASLMDCIYPINLVLETVQCCCFLFLMLQIL